MAQERLSIKDWPEDERPREKAMAHGIASLSKAELLAILVGSGSVDDSAVGLMKKVLASCGDSIAELSKRSVDDLCRFKGIGPAKALIIVAVCELWKRRQSDERDEHKRIQSSCDLYEYFHPLLCNATVEECHVLLLNNMNRMIDCVKIGSGGLTATLVDIRMVIREALLKRATAVALCHNHPSGSKRPSAEDDRITRNLSDACKIMNIRMLDHIIIAAGNGYYSYADEGHL